MHSTSSIAEIVKALTDIQSPFNMMVILGLFALVAGVVTTAFVQLRAYFCHRADTHLKRELVERGLSVDEIERVIAAKPAKTEE